MLCELAFHTVASATKHTQETKAIPMTSGRLFGNDAITNVCEVSRSRCCCCSRFGGLGPVS
jgi:hypothetical protein